MGIKQVSLGEGCPKKPRSISPTRFESEDLYSSFYSINNSAMPLLRTTSMLVVFAFFHHSSSVPQPTINFARIGEQKNNLIASISGFKKDLLSPITGIKSGIRGAKKAIISPIVGLDSGLLNAKFGLVNGIKDTKLGLVKKFLSPIADVKRSKLLPIGQLFSKF